MSAVSLPRRLLFTSRTVRRSRPRLRLSHPRRERRRSFPSFSIGLTPRIHRCPATISTSILILISRAISGCSFLRASPALISWSRRIFFRRVNISGAYVHCMATLLVLGRLDAPSPQQLRQLHHQI